MRTGTGTGVDVHPETPRFFVTGACGQIGQEFLPFLRSKVGVDNVIASDVRTSRRLLESGPFSYCDVLDKDNMARIILENGITHVIHLATLLSVRCTLMAQAPFVFLSSHCQCCLVWCSYW